METPLDVRVVRRVGAHSDPSLSTFPFVTIFTCRHSIKVHSNNMSDLENELLGLAEDDPRARKRAAKGAKPKTKE